MLTFDFQFELIDYIYTFAALTDFAYATAHFQWTQMYLHPQVWNLKYIYIHVQTARFQCHLF